MNCDPCGARDGRRGGGDAGRPPAQTVAVERGEVRKTVTADGTLRALTTVAVKSDAGGLILNHCG